MYLVQACNGYSVCSLDSNPATAAVGATMPPPSAAQCSNGMDDDGDGKIDYPADPGCSSAADASESSSSDGGTGGGGGTSSCGTALTALLGTDCHSMGTDTTGNTIYCNGPMTKSAKYGDTVTTAGCSTSSGGGSGSGGGCGNGTCESSESSASCPADCGSGGGGCPTFAHYMGSS
mgnify:CR=1 FL=1